MNGFHDLPHGEAHNWPNPAIKHPIPMHTRVGFLKPLVSAANIEIGDFTYYDDPEGPDKFQEKSCTITRSLATG